MTTTITALNTETPKPLTSREERMFRFLIADESPYVRMKALSNPACPEELLYEAVKVETDLKALSAIVSNPVASGRVLHRLIGSSDPFMRKELAAHTNTRSADLITLATDINPYVLGAVALNPYAPKKALGLALETAQQIEPHNDFVPFHVARHRRASQRVLRLLGTHDSYRVRVEVVKNPHTPFGVIQHLMGDDDARVRGALASRLGGSVRVADMAG